MSYYQEMERTWRCYDCKWEGPGKDLSPKIFRDCFEGSCPQCGAELGTIFFPTRQESGAAALAGNEEARLDWEMGMVRKTRQERFEHLKLRGPEDLPDLPGNRLHFLWDFSEGQPFHSDTIIRLGRKILWVEPAFYEGCWRFNEVRSILQARYGEQFCAFTPTTASWLYLFGDDIHAPEKIGGLELEEAGLDGIYEGGATSPGVNRRNSFDKAFAYASHLHRNQNRKGTSVPYISHLMAVASLVLEFGGTEVEAIAALLHDAVEDQGGAPILDEIRRRFGSAVADIVESCSEPHSDLRPPWLERKTAYIDGIAGKSASARLVAAADKLQNVRSMLQDYRVIGEELWKRFNVKKEDSLWFLRTVTTELSRAERTPIVAELELAVAELGKIAEEQPAMAS